MLAALSLLLVSAFAVAQGDLRDLLPNSTLVAVELDSAGLHSGALTSFVTETRSPDAEAALGALKGLISEVAPEGRRHRGPRTLDAPVRTEACTPFMDVLRDVRARPWSAALGITMPGSEPVPDGVLLVRPGSAALSARLLAGAVACFDGRWFAEQDGTPIYRFVVDGEEAAYLAVHGDVLAASNSTDLVRGALRRLAGSSEPSFAGTRASARAAEMGPAGFKLTVNPQPLVTILRVLAKGAPSAESALVDRLVNTLRGFDGYVVSGSLTGEALVASATLGFDLAALADSGETDLVRLIACGTCDVTNAATLLPGATMSSAQALPVEAFIGWVDSWLASAAQAGLIDDGAASVRGAAWLYGGVDLGELLLDWFGGAAYTDVAGVLDTDLVNWVNGPPMLTAFPVTSEEAAWHAVHSWFELMDSSAASVGGHGYGAGIEGAVAVQEFVHGNVEVMRVRFGPTLDLGVAVHDGHLFVGSPTSVLLEGIDRRSLGTTVDTGLARTARTLAADSAGVLAGYRLIDTPAVISGLGQVLELSSGSVATSIYWLVEAAKQGEFGLTAQEAARGMAPFTFTDALSITDAVTAALGHLADSVGVLTKTVVVEDGAVTTTYALPLGQ